MTPTTVMWFRRDLRLADLPALHAAAEAGRVVPLFVVDPTFAGSGVPRQAFMADALHALDDSMGGALVYRHGDPTEVVPALAAEVGATAVYVSRDYGPYGCRRDASVGAALQSIGAKLHGIGSPYAVAPGSVTKADGTPYAVFTPFSKAWRAIGWDAPLGVPDVRWFGAPEVPCDGPPVRPVCDVALPPSSEQAAHEQWEQYLPAAERYRDDRNLPAVAGTSRLSTALRWGLVHPRQLLADLQPGPGHDTFASELAWREFYADVLFRRPETAWQNLNPKMEAMTLDDGPVARARFEQWAEGRTGYPIVDAGMRELLATGWMHNRVRMLVASFLVKDLHLPWQWGARHFMQHLVDGDLASNSHGWQWTAGTGTDAAPYFRIFNPTTQALRFDPDGEYVRRWVPELAGIAGGGVHEPGLLRPADYPAPVVDHAVERDEALARYRQVTAGSR
ncbi:MAG: deoxyribodipyrimidine photo-lyase [Ilumatobacteraceae bacterium]